ncbi:MAG: hypothetical protein HQL09_06680 [Nitrospirae bacterium]|nr:hypothetical protein [Nitrospirota bacterium]
MLIVLATIGNPYGKNLDNSHVEPIMMSNYPSAIVSKVNNQSDARDTCCETSNGLFD